MHVHQTLGRKRDATSFSRSNLSRQKHTISRIKILLALILGPSDPKLREHFFLEARAKPKVFVGSGSVIGKQWVTIFSKELLAKAGARNMDDDQKVMSLTSAWAAFIEHDLPKLTNALIEIAQSAPMP
jgi:hypothetical protein